MEVSISITNLCSAFVGCYIISAVLLLFSCTHDSTETKIIGHKKTKWRLYSNRIDSTKVDEEIIFDTIFIQNPPNILDTLWGDKESKAIYYVVKQIKWNSGPFRGPEDPIGSPCTDRREDTITIYGKRMAKTKTEVSIIKHFCNTDTIIIGGRSIIPDEKRLPLKKLDTIYSTQGTGISCILQIYRKYDKNKRIIEEKQIVTDDRYLYNWYRYEYSEIKE
jgi:hypothetical protein